MFHESSILVIVALQHNWGKSLSSLELHTDWRVASDPDGRARYVARDPVEARVLDIVGAALLLIAFAPLMLLISATIMATSPGPVIFKQMRIGRDGRLFACYKFRTMAIDAEERLATLLANDPAARMEWAQAQKLRKDPRIVGIGNFLRKSSLDELPQLWNVLRGDMSLVGPRPIVRDETERYGKYIVFYCSVKPGLTGLWQVSGRNDTTYRRRVAYDVLYARKGTVWDNVKILAMTVPSVVMSRGTY